jgi:hypothetical protein
MAASSPFSRRLYVGTPRKAVARELVAIQTPGYESEVRRLSG